MAAITSDEVATKMEVDTGPYLYLSDKDLDGIGKLEIGETITMVIKAKVKSLSQNDYGHGTKKNVSLCITKINNKTPTSHSEMENDLDEDD